MKHPEELPTDSELKLLNPKALPSGVYDIDIIIDDKFLTHIYNDTNDDQAN